MAIGSSHFLDDVTAHAPLPAHVPTVEAAVAVVSALLHRLTPGQAHRLVMALPEALRPTFDAALRARERERTIATFGRAELLADLGLRLSVTPATAEAIAAAVFEGVRASIAPDVAANVAAQLPHDLRDLWLGAHGLAELERGETDLEARDRFLEVLRSRGALPDGVPPDEAVAAVMCTFAQRLSGGEAGDLLLALPRTIRPLVMRCFRHPENAATFDAEQLVARVAEHLGTDAARARSIVGAVFDAVRSVIPADQIEDAASQLPADLRDLWVGP